MENILIIGAHYDDAELGVGGTAAKLVSEGKNVYKLTLTDNVTKSKHLHINVEYESSLSSSLESSKILGVKEIENFTPIECNKLTYNTEIMQKIEDIIFDNKIDTVFIHFENDMNQDHIAAHQLSLTASRHCRNVFAYQSNLYILAKPYYPTYFVDISDFINLKIKALSQYSPDHNRFSKLFQVNIERNKVWGFSNKCSYAEGFHIIKMMME